MTKEEIIEMARQAGARQMVSSLTHPNGPVTALKFDLDSESIEAFTKLVAEHERKECADMIEDLENIDWNIWDCAKAIRERCKND